MSKKRDKTSSQGQPLVQGDDGLDSSTSTQLTTVLGKHISSSAARPKQGSGIVFVLLILLVAVLAGGGAYVYYLQTQAASVRSQYSSLEAQTQRVSGTAALVMSGDTNAWNTFDRELAAFKTNWAALMRQGGHLNGAETTYREFIAALQQLNNFKSLNPTQPAAQQIGQYALVVAGSGDKLAPMIRNAGLVATEDFENQIMLVGGGALAAALILLILAFTVVRKIAKDSQGGSLEKMQLVALVEDLQSEAEQQRHAAQEQVAAARRVNEANQAAILRLMNELQNLAEGDLTQQATVTEDITGAIADSVNYTMEELRNLVSQVQSATELVSKTTAVVESTSTELLASSDEQLREIRETGQAVLDVAARINNVSTQAQQSAAVARQSLDAAEKGMLAVQNAIGGMNTIRDQIQDTSKRIKRLVESSQEIGEITDLIADITEQTNVLALNAAIQAASAGEAGRGFSVVAEEVQRLAERSAAATRQIAVLIKTIQGDMQDAMAAMERSTQGVVEGARQSDETGTAFTEIDSVTRRLASLIQQIAEQTQNEAVAANGVAENIQHIFAVTGQTADGTRSTAQQVRELARVAEQLERSVARFRIS